MRDFEKAILYISMFQRVAEVSKGCKFIDYDTAKKSPHSYDGYALYDNNDGVIMFPDRDSESGDLLIPIPRLPTYLIDDEGLIAISLKNIHVFIRDGRWWAVTKNE